MFGAIYAAEGSSPEALLAVAQEFSPRVDAGSHDRDFREIVLDLHTDAKATIKVSVLGEQ